MQTREDQFDIAMYNGEAVALIEVKYKARKSYLNKMLKQKIYLGLGGMSCIGLLKQVGETIECKNRRVRAY